MDSGQESYNDIISTEILENIRDGSQSHTNVNQKEARYIICDRSRQKKSELKGALKATRDMDKGLHKVFNNV